MLSLSTERKALEFNLDGNRCSIPIELSLDETRSMGEAYASASAENRAGEDATMGDLNSGLAMIRWFSDYASRYVPEAGKLPFEALSKLLKAWQQARQDAAGATEGE
ncbi:MAG: hypothetical protein PUD09_00140 [Coriobacteriales bacterium]|nr:hypothetical protein [Coriobacteriales bacterium]